jgi:hypothetical protein
MTESILSLSIAFDTDLADASRVVGESLNQFNLDASQSNRVADNMAVLFGSSALDLEKFGTAMSVVGPTASAMGLSIEQAGAALGTLVNAGVDASTAGTSLTKALTTLAAKGMTGDEALTSLFNGTLSVAEGFEIFGDRAGKIIPVLQKSGEAYGTLIQKQNEGTGAANKARKVLEGTAQGGFDKLKSSIEALGIAFGDVLLPFVNNATNFISNLTSKLSTMDSSTMTLIATIGAIAAAIGPLLFLLPQLGAAFTLMTGPVGLTIGALALLGVAIYTFSDEVGQALAPVINWFISLYNESVAVRTVIGGLKAVVKTVFNFFGLAINNIIESFKDIGTIISAAMAGDFSSIPGIIADSFERGGERAAEFARQAAEDWRSSIEEELTREPIELVTPESISAGIESLGGLKDAFDAMFSGGGGGGVAGPARPANMTAMTMRTGASMPAAAELVSGTGPVTALAEGMGRLRTEFSMTLDLTQQIDAAFVGLGMAVGGLIAGTMTFGEIFAQSIAGLASLLMDLGQQFIAAGVAASAFYASIISNPPLAIAAGVALVAAGAAIKGFQSRAESSPPALAKGGLAFGETLALVGDNPNAGTDPEVIAPLSKLQGMMGGGQAVTVTGRISGRDILLSNDRTSRARARYSGY